MTKRLQLGLWIGLPTLLVALLMAGCQSVEVQYRAPSAAGDFGAAEAQAKEHFEYVAFPKTFILVRPVEDGAAAGKGLETAQQRISNPSGSATAVGTVAATKGASSNTNTTSSVGGKSSTGGAGATGAKAPVATAPSALASANTGGTAKKDDEASAAPAAAPNPDALTTAIIDGKKWEARVVMVPDDTRVFVVKGVSGFWKQTTIGLTKYPNTDMVSSVASTAENLVPKRIGQAASIIATVLKFGSMGAVDTSGSMPMQSFVLEVPSKNISQRSINDAWSYKFEFDSSKVPPGTVSFDEFSKQTVNRTVGYWPVPACRSATLTVGRDDGIQVVFHMTVSSPDAVRLQPLPVSGKVDFGSVCGATTSGTSVADPLSAASDDINALLQAVKTVNDAKSSTPAASAAGGGKSGGSSGSSDSTASSGSAPKK